MTPIIIPASIYKSLKNAERYHKKYKKNAEIVKDFFIKNNIPVDTPLSNIRSMDKVHKIESKFIQTTIADFI